MTLAPLISWIDREWDAFPNARNSLGLILAALWVPLMLIGWTTITVSVGVVWTGFWVGLFAWRWLRWIRRLGRIDIHRIQSMAAAMWTKAR